MVELGKTQTAENAALAERAAGVLTDLVVVGRTNRAALVEGCRRAGLPLSVSSSATREEAVAWRREQLGPGDACCSRMISRITSLKAPRFGRRRKRRSGGPRSVFASSVA